ncbi:hypothetical protein RvY_10901 [Ramazzottius varieornatus]|uniref:Folliculin n=1 Tax=Ramazzottius varieornatus TaxID=947166 RepID=A0A1D1VIP5_RAMVA|nr:hypothetical protein RvY_10901 [Ramazzottius varieornatus]
MDRISLLQSWPFLTRSSRSLVSLLQEQAERTYGVDQAERPQRAARLNPSEVAINPGNFRRQRRGKAMRSLPELTLDNGVFHVLHEHFTHLLQLGGNQMSETLLEGAPSCYYQDIPADEAPSSPTQNSEERDNERPKSTASYFPRFTGIAHLFNAVGKPLFRSLAHSLIIGNQVIVRGYHDFLVTSVIRALAVLIPPGCCKSIEFSQTYTEPWNCNLLGLHPDASLPDHVLTSSESYFVVDILAAKMNEMNVEKYKIITPTQATTPVKPSSYLLLVEHILQEVDLVEEVAVDLIRNQHERLMTKAKVLYKLFRTESRSATQLPAMMEKFRITPEDDVVLKFWMTALSSEYKAHLKELSALPTPSSTTLYDRSRRSSADSSPGTPVSFQPVNVERSRTRKISLVNR